MLFIALSNSSGRSQMMQRVISVCEHHQQLYLDQCRTHLKKKIKREREKYQTSKTNKQTRKFNNARQPNAGAIKLIFLSDLRPLFLWPWSYCQHLEPSSAQPPFWKGRCWQSSSYSSANPLACHHCADADLVWVSSNLSFQ